MSGNEFFWVFIFYTPFYSKSGSSFLYLYIYVMVLTVNGRVLGVGVLELGV